MKETQARLADTGIEVLDIELFRMDPTLEPESFIPVLDAAAELGAKHIIAQLPDPDRKRATDRFARLCDLAKPLGIFVSLEFPHWTETGDLATAAKVVRDVKRNNAGILIDMLHMGRSDSSTEELAKMPREWFRFAHVCDAAKEVPPTMEGIIHTARDERQFPGEGGIDVRGHPGLLCRRTFPTRWKSRVSRLPGRWARRKSRCWRCASRGAISTASRKSPVAATPSVAIAARRDAGAPCCIAQTARVVLN